MNYKVSFFCNGRFFEELLMFQNEFATFCSLWEKCCFLNFRKGLEVYFTEWPENWTSWIRQSFNVSVWLFLLWHQIILNKHLTFFTTSSTMAFGRKKKLEEENGLSWEFKHEIAIFPGNFHNTKNILWVQRLCVCFAPWTFDLVLQYWTFD